MFRRGERGCDGSHNRAARQALAMRGFQAGELAGNRQGKENSAPSVAKELPLWLIRRVLQFHSVAPCLAGCAQPPQ